MTHTYADGAAQLHDQRHGHRRGRHVRRRQHGYRHRQQRGADAHDQRRGQRQRRLAVTRSTCRRPIRAPTRSRQWTINWGDGTQVCRGNPSSVTHTYADGTTNYTISATATDEDGTFAAGNTVAVTVNNVAPTLTISGAASVNEGSSYTLNCRLRSGADTISQWTINWGDGTQVVSGNPSSVTHTYADGTDSYTISATATDEDGTYAAGNTVAVTVNNVAPTLAISGAASQRRSTTHSTCRRSIRAPTRSITGQSTGATARQVVARQSVKRHAHLCRRRANYTISATATDEDGTFAAGNTVAVTVHNVAPTVECRQRSPSRKTARTERLSAPSLRTIPGTDTLSYSIVGGTGTAAFADQFVDRDKLPWRTARCSIMTQHLRSRSMFRSATAKAASALPR